MSKYGATTDGTVGKMDEYEIEIELTVRRRKGSYDTNKMASVQVKETLFLFEHQLPEIFASMVTEARTKATGVMGIKQNYEREMRALESGSTVVDA